MEAARLSLVRPLVETNKVLAAKDLNDDELDDLTERSRSTLVRTDLLEPFREQFTISHTRTIEDRVSPSRSVGNVSPTSDLSLMPCLVETELGTADAHVCDVLFEEEMIPAPVPDVYRPPAPVFDASGLLVVEDNFPEGLTAVDEMATSCVSPDYVELELYETTATEIELFQCDEEEEEMISMTKMDFVDRAFQASVRWTEERTSSPVVVEECRLEPDAVTAATLTSTDVRGADLEAASVVENDICFIEEESFVVEARVDVQQLLKLTQQQMMWSEQRCVSPFADDSRFVGPIAREAADLSTTLAAPDVHVSDHLSRADVHEADVYYYEEESISVDVVCDLTQMMRMTQRDLIISEERTVAPVQDESVFVQQLWTSGNRYKLVKHHCLCDLIKCNFSNRVITVREVCITVWFLSMPLFNTYKKQSGFTWLREPRYCSINIIRPSYGGGH